MTDQFLDWTMQFLEQGRAIAAKHWAALPFDAIKLDRKKRQLQDCLPYGVEGIILEIELGNPDFGIEKIFYQEDWWKSNSDYTLRVSLGLDGEIFAYLFRRWRTEADKVNVEHVGTVANPVTVFSPMINEMLGYAEEKILELNRRVGFLSDKAERMQVFFQK